MDIFTVVRTCVAEAKFVIRVSVGIGEDSILVRVVLNFSLREFERWHFKLKAEIDQQTL